jgi:hypothetical protein
VLDPATTANVSVGGAGAAGADGTGSTMGSGAGKPGVAMQTVQR